MGEPTYEFPREKRRLSSCPDCGAPVGVPMQRGQHARRQAVIDGQLRLVNCVGRVLR